MPKQTQNIIVAIIATALVVGGGVYLFLNKGTDTNLAIETSSPGMEMWQSNYFTFEYPEKYVTDELGLWTEERYKNHITTGPADCSVCHMPQIEVRSELTSATFEEYIIQDMDLQGTDLSTAIKPLGIPVQTIVLGENTFIKINIGDLHDVHTYYTQKDARIVSFQVFDREYDTDELREIISTLKFK
jgi:hypothetical protein